MRAAVLSGLLGVMAAGLADYGVAQTVQYPAAPQVTRFEVGMEATVSQICGAFSSATAPAVVDFGDLATVAQGQALPLKVVAADVAYICNEPNGFVRTISSQNGGRLVRVGSAGGAGNEIPYRVSGTGAGLAFGLQQLNAPVVSYGVDPVFLAGSAGPIQIEMQGVRSNIAQNGTLRTTVFAGSYVDALTISVIAN